MAMGEAQAILAQGIANANAIKFIQDASSQSFLKIKIKEFY